MSRLRIQIEKIVSEGFDLEIPAESGASDRVVLARVVHLRGTYEHDARQIWLRRLAADELGIAQLAWHWGEGRDGGRIVLPGASDLAGVVLDLAIARAARKVDRALTGSITVARATLAEIGLTLGELQLAGAVTLAGLEVLEAADGAPSRVAVAELHARGLHVTSAGLPVTATELSVTGLRVARSGSVVDVDVGRVQAAGLRLRLGDVQIVVSSLVATGVRARREGDATDVEIGACELRGVELVQGGSHVRIDELLVPSGLRFTGGELTVPSTKFGAAQVEVHLAPAGAEPAPSSTGRRRKRRVDLRLLDLLGGRVDVDATVDARVPFLKRRLATHRFRVPIEDGTIDFKKLEGDLSLLEDSLLDFEVRRGKLVLEVKPPLLSFAKKTLVDWELAPEEIVLAERHRVHLRTLASPRIHAGDDEAPKKSAGESSFELTRLDLDPIEAELRLGGPTEIAFGDEGVIHLGTSREPAIAELHVRGALHHRAQGEGPPTEIHVTAKKLRLGAEGIAVGTWVASVEALVVASVEDAVVVLRGARPVAVRASLHGVGLGALRVAPAAPRRRR